MRGSDAASVGQYSKRGCASAGVRTTVICEYSASVIDKGLNMVRSKNRLTAGDFVQALPSAEQLPELRAMTKRLKPPKLPAGAQWSNSKVGGYSTKAGADGVIVTWRPVDGQERTAPFDALGCDPLYEAERLELGWMVANMLGVEAARMLQCIPGPNEAMSEANKYYREEDRWRAWALWGSIHS